MQVGLSIRYGFDMVSLNNLIDDIHFLQHFGQHIVVEGCLDGQNVDDWCNAVFGDVLDPA